MVEDREALDAHIRRRAYELWEEAGRPEGQHEELWHRARLEIIGENTLAESPGNENGLPSESNSAAGRG